VRSGRKTALIEEKFLGGTCNQLWLHPYQDDGRQR